ncbi:glutamate racemase [Solitalea lacus]|uniref:glutamate racemase n=1 Tax=Solitalea lacus TaxID=2911172 RepID=UPI001EDB6845|nr:glutamate racemase [Solitalea lacus]UKJ07027.1 glutamate racemase [Solitalea lacus]
MQQGPIGVFDSGYGGLTVLKEVVRQLPDYDYLYLGDNARAPYGTRSFETVYHYTLECVNYLFSQGCSLIILACNTASAKALRSIQQNDLPKMTGNKRVLGVIRPTAEIVGNMTRSKQIGILGTAGTVASGSYPIEIQKYFPQVGVHQEACPMWVPLVENDEYDSPGADYFVKQHLERLLNKSSEIDTIVLGCTHYPLLAGKILKYLSPDIKLLSQGEIVAHSLSDYLNRHPEIEALCSRHGQRHFLTTDSIEVFEKHASRFFGKPVRAEHIDLV